MPSSKGMDNMTKTLERTHAHFTDTSWTRLGELARSDGEQRRIILNELSSRYWPPIYAVLRKRGHGQEQAREIAQAFFTEAVLGRDLFDRADARRGKLRSLLCRSLENYEKDHFRREVSRGAGRKISLDELTHEEAFLASEPDASPDEVYLDRWNARLLEDALERARDRLIARNLERHWHAFDLDTLWPARTGNRRPAQERIAAELDYPNRAAVADAIRTVKKKVRIAFREVVRETVCDEDDVESEYEDLCARLGISTTD